MLDFIERYQIAEQLLTRLFARDYVLKEVQKSTWEQVYRDRPNDLGEAMRRCRAACEVAMETDVLISEKVQFAQGTALFLRGMLYFLHDETMWDQSVQHCSEAANIFAIKSPNLIRDYVPLPPVEAEYLQAQGIAWFAVGRISEAQCCGDRERWQRGLQAYLKSAYLLDRVDETLAREAKANYSRLAQSFPHPAVQKVVTPAPEPPEEVVESDPIQPPLPPFPAPPDQLESDPPTRPPAVMPDSIAEISPDPLGRTIHSFEWGALVGVLSSLVGFLMIVLFFMVIVKSPLVTLFGWAFIIALIVSLFLTKNFIIWTVPPRHQGISLRGSAWNILDPGRYRAYAPGSLCIVMPTEIVIDTSLPYELDTLDNQKIEMTVTFSYQVCEPTVTARFIHRRMSRSQFFSGLIRTQDARSEISSYLQDQLEFVMRNLIAHSTSIAITQRPKKVGRDIRQEMTIPARQIGLTLLVCSIRCVEQSQAHLSPARAQRG